MSFALSTLKFTAFVMNVLLCIFGGLMLSASAYALVAFSASASIRIPCIIGVVLGSLLFLSTILGCCGTIRESVRLSWTYSICILLLLASQLVVIFLLPVDYNKLANETIQNAWQQQLNQNDAMSTYEIKYACCGTTGPNSYLESGLKIPPSCYLDQSPTSELFTTGCAQRLTFEFEQNARIEIISDWTLVGVEGVAVVIAGLLAISLQNIKRRRLYH